MTVAADGVISNGTRVPELGAGTVGPDGVAYGVTGDDASDIWAVDLSGMRTGWPVTFDGFASGPAFGPGGRVAVIVGSPTNGTSQVLVFDRDGNAVRGRSAAIPIVTVDENWGTAGGCPPWPKPPLVASDGTIFIFSEATPAVMAVDPSLKLMPGWPYRPAAPLVLRDERYVKEDAYCPSIAIPAVGPDTTLYLPLQAADATVGGSIVAVGPDGRLRPGGPVELKRPGAESWSVIVGSEGTVYVLAIEPEGVNASSATILAIAPDSTVLWTTTIIDP
jgi:outer membrane protein assembly factor BamB